MLYSLNNPTDSIVHLPIGLMDKHLTDFRDMHFQFIKCCPYQPGHILQRISGRVDGHSSSGKNFLPHQLRLVGVSHTQYTTHLAARFGIMGKHAYGPSLSIPSMITAPLHRRRSCCRDHVVRMCESTPTTTSIFFASPERCSSFIDYRCIHPGVANSTSYTHRGLAISALL